MKYSELKIGHTINGDEINIPIYEFQSSTPGPKVYIQSGVHGAEIQGHLVIKQLIDWLGENEFHGTWTLVPFANPFSLHNYQGEFTQGRFDPISGNNWNRDYHLLTTQDEENEVALNIEHFYKEHSLLNDKELKEKFSHSLLGKLKNIEKKQKIYGDRLGKILTTKLQQLFFDADIVLDLHTAHQSKRYLYAPEFTREETQHFNFPFTLFIPPDFAHACDESAFVPWYQLDQKLRKHNRSIHINRAFTLELGAQETINSSAANSDKNCILNYLKYKKAHSNTIEIIKSPLFTGELKNFKYYYSQNSGLIEYIAKPGDLISKGDPLFKQLIKRDREIKWNHIYAVKDCYIVSRSDSSNARMGTQIYQVIEEYSKTSPV